jgi:hypothetical protein
LKDEEISSALGGYGQSAHGAERLLERGFNGEDIVDTLNGDTYVQSDGATAYVSNNAGKYNVIVIGDQGVVAALRGVSVKSVSALARNYGWEGWE